MAASSHGSRHRCRSWSWPVKGALSGSDCSNGRSAVTAVSRYHMSRYVDTCCSNTRLLLKCHFSSAHSMTYRQSPGARASDVQCQSSQIKRYKNVFQPYSLIWTTVFLGSTLVMLNNASHPSLILLILRYLLKLNYF